MKIRITDDLYDIAWRLRAIDNYDVFYNLIKGRYEIYSDGKLEIVVPYSELDERTVKLVRKTRRERLDKIMREIDEHNKKIEMERQKKLLETTDYKTKSLYQYLSHHENSNVSYEEL